MQCSRCSRDAIVFQPYSGLHLCDQHLIADVEAKAKKMIRAQGWLTPGDHIAVLLQGDQRSSALLFFLKHLTAQRRDIRITAIAIAEGTGGSRDSQAKRVAECLHTEFIEVAWPEESDCCTEISTGRTRDPASLPVYSVPHSIRLDMIARQHGITKIAWGLCLDDAAAVVLGNIIRGDGENLVGSTLNQDSLPRICPFISVTAAEVSLYATHCGLGEGLEPGPDQRVCTYKDMVAILDAYTNNHPATKYALLNLGENLAGPHKGITGLINTCEGNWECQRGYCNESARLNEVTNGTR
jgi:tRNA(Ile)-lysidine synthase TilS/MesJ